MSLNSAVAARQANLAVFLVLLAIGAITLAAGLILNYERRAMVGIAIVCLPTGLLGAASFVLSLRWMEKNRPEVLRKQADAMDERLIQILHSAGHSAFWASYAYAVILTMLSATQIIRSINQTWLGLLTLLVMAASYCCAFAVFRRKY